MTDVWAENQNTKRGFPNKDIENPANREHLVRVLFNIRMTTSQKHSANVLVYFSFFNVTFAQHM
jgi:hypothetical protein